MKEEELEEYQKIKKEIKLLDEEIKKEKRKEIPIVLGTVRGSMHDFPYLEKRTVVEMYEPGMSDEKNKLIKMRQKKKQELEYVAYQIESYIDEVPDSEMRMILKMRYIDGLTQDKIARRINIDQSRVSRRISNYMKNA